MSGLDANEDAEDATMEMHLAMMQALQDLAGAILTRRRTPRAAIEAICRALEIGGRLLDADAEALRARHWREHPKATRHEPAGSR